MSDTAVSRLTLKDVALALSLANICFVPVWLEILAVTTREAYFLDVANADVLAALTNVLLLAALFLAATAIARGYGVRGRRVLIAGFVVVLLLRLNTLGPELAPGIFAVTEPWKNGKYLEALAPVLLLAGIAGAAWRWPARTLGFARGAVLVFAPFVAVTLGRGLWILITVNPTDALAARAPEVGAPVPTRDGPRVVVIVMDAMSRRHAFDARPADVTLPAFDRLRAEALDATQVTQIGWVTRVSVPAMLTGLPVTDADPSSKDELLLQVAGDTAQPLSTAPNILEEAQELGGAAVVVGWYFPYCRVFSELDGCATFPTRTIGSRGRETGYLRAVLDQQIASLPYVNLRMKQIALVEEQVEDAREAVTLGDQGLIFVHLIVPHTPWIWDEDENDFTATRFEPDGYYGNLELADRILGQLRQEMETAGKWDSTAVLVLSDHVMRYRPAYLDEPHDIRVPFILKLPGQRGGVVYDRPFNAMVTHELVQALLRDELRDAPAAARWLDARATPVSDPTVARR